MGQVTLRDLNEWIDIQAEQESARSAFEVQQRRRRSFTDWIIALMPVFGFLAALAFYALSAPHTVGLLDKITPGFGWVSPVGIELFIVVISAVRQLKWRTLETTVMLYGLLLVAVIVNIAGGMLAVLKGAEDTGQGIDKLNFASLLEKFPALPAAWQIVFVLVPIIGFLIPVAGKFGGAFFMKLAMGEISFQTVSVDDLWLKERLSLVKSALMRAAMKRGAGARTAGAWAQRVVDELFGDDDGSSVEAVSGTVSIVPAVSGVRAEMGFAASATARTDTQNSQDSGTRQTVLRAKQVVDWADVHADELKLMLARPGKKRAISQAISREIAGSDAGYKTVERVLKAKGYDF